MNPLFSISILCTLKRSVKKKGGGEGNKDLIKNNDDSDC